MTAPEHGDWSGRWPENLNALTIGRLLYDLQRDFIHLLRRRRRQNHCGESSKRREAKFRANFPLDLQKSVTVIVGQRHHGRIVGRISLNQCAPGALGPPCPARNLAEQLVGPLTSAQVSALHAAVSIYNTNQGKIWEIVSLGHDLRADQDINFTLLHSLHDPGAVSEEKISMRASGSRVLTSSATRSTPGPTPISESAAPQWGQAFGLGME